MADNQTTLISTRVEAAHECEYRAREMRQALHEWYAMSEPIKRAIYQDAAATLEKAEQALRAPTEE